MPGDKGDLVAFSSDDGLVLVVDATLEPKKDLKSANLFRRTKEMSARLSDVTGRDPPHVEALLVIGVPYEQVAQHLKSPYPEISITILARDQIARVLETIKQGIPLSEAVGDLPDILRYGERTMQRFIVWRGDYF